MRSGKPEQDYAKEVGATIVIADRVQAAAHVVHLGLPGIAIKRSDGNYGSNTSQ
ncbi:hypothetical protein [Woeseia oceani]|uniref:hypothetical protein n=1 Tax=Woeseia oceani TaxID=1548547 RepID=UPI0012E9FB85|nr:hypothetical protein [Woeseia oceani]